MSSSIKDIFYHALLARAAYADLKEDTNLVDELVNNVQSAMSKDMAKFIQARFEFVDSSLDNDFQIDPVIDPTADNPIQIIDPQIEGDGYDGIIFKEKGTEHYVLANRGTEAQLSHDKFFSTIADLWSDASLGIEGNNAQTATMQAFLENFRAQHQLDPSATFTTTGHSLGGFLAAYAIKEDGYDLDYAYGFNGAGYRPDADFIEKTFGLLEDIETVKGVYEKYKEQTGYEDADFEQFIANSKFDKASKALSRIKILVSAGLVAANNIAEALGFDPFSLSGDMTNIITEEGLDLVSGSGLRVGETQEFLVDLPVGADPMAEHGIIPLTDALTYAYALATIDDKLSINTANEIVRAMHNTAGQRLDWLSNYLYKVFVNSSEDFSQELDSIQQKELFELINKFEADLQTGEDAFVAKIYTLFNSDTDILLNNAEQDTTNGLLMRHALLNRSSFTLAENISTDPNQNTDLTMMAGLMNAQTLYDVESFNDGFELDMSEQLGFWYAVSQMSAMMYDNNRTEKHNGYESQKDGIQVDYQYNDSGNHLYINAWTETANLTNPFMMFEDLNIEMHINSEQEHQTNAQTADIVYVGSNFEDTNYVTSIGDDKYFGLGGDDTFDGGEGDDFLNGGADNDTLTGGRGDDILSGGSGDDVLNDDGSHPTEPLKDPEASDNDILYGGEGNDTLTTSGGNDTLVGGADFDTYDLWFDNDGSQNTYGFDTIIDSDGKGVIKMAGQTVDAEQTVVGNIYLSSNGKFYVEHIEGQGELSTLKIWEKDGVAGTVTVKNWKDGDLGIDLGLTEYKPEINLVDYAPVFDLDANGDIVNQTNGKPVKNLINLFYTSKPIDYDGEGMLHILGGKMGDTFDFENQDVALKIEAGDGSDIIITGNRDDVIWVDNIHGWHLQEAYKDYLNNPPPPDADLINELAVDNTNKIYGNWSNAVRTGSGDDSVYGGYGIDHIAGGAGNDRLFGAGNIDELSGGDGNDLIHGDGVVVKQFLPEYARDSFNYNFNADEDYRSNNSGLDYDLLNDHTYSYTSMVAGTPTSSSRRNLPELATNLIYHGDDLLSGGEGNDIIIGEGGSDYIDGGKDDDLILGDNINTINQIKQLGFDSNNEVTNYVDEYNSLEYRDLEKQWRAEFSGKDKLYGREGNDTIYGGSKSDYIEGNEGNDIIYADSDLYTKHNDESSVTDKAKNMGDDGENSFLFNYQDIGKNAISINKFTIFGNDKILGGIGDDTIYGEGGDDFIDGGGDDDILHGDANFFIHDEKDKPNHGDDRIIGGAGQDSIYGGGGSDTIFGGTDDDKISGDYQETLLSGEFHGADDIDAGEGNDKVWGQGGNDTIKGGLGEDIIAGDAVQSELEGEWHGADILEGNEGDDHIYGMGKNDVISGGTGDDYIRGDNSSDYLDGQWHGDDNINGDAGDDRILGDGGRDTISGGLGNDKISGDSSQLDGQWHGDDALYGNDGDDQIWGNGGHDTISGGLGNDKISGDSSQLDGQWHGDDALYGNYGDDQIWGNGGHDTISGGAGDDYIEGDSRELDIQFHGNDQIFGGSGNDTVYGGGGNDALYGDEGDDFLIAGQGEDHLYGGAGEDVYYFDLATLQDGKTNYIFDTDRKGQILLGDDNLLDNNWQILSISNNADKSDIIVKWQDGLGNYMEYNANNIIITSDNFTSKIVAEGYNVERKHGGRFVVDSDQNSNEPFSHMITDQTMFNLSGNSLLLNSLLPNLQKDQDGNFEVEYQIEYYDPLVLDLNKDGIINTVAENNKQGVMFDNNGDGIKTATGWLSSEDGFLVRDINKDGVINNGKEMFGDQTKLSDGAFAKHGFEALNDLDSNADGVINKDDISFSEIRVWQDINIDGVTSQDELKTLEQVGISELNLSFDSSKEIQTNGGTVKEQGSYLDNNGNASLMADINFDQDLIHSEFISTSDEQTDGLNISGFGRLDDLADVAKGTDELSTLAEYLEKNKDIENIFNQSDRLLELWAGTDFKNTDSEIAVVENSNIKWTESENAEHKIRLTPNDGIPQYLGETSTSNTYSYLNQSDKQTVKLIDAITGIDPTEYVNQATSDQTSTFLNVYQNIKTSVESDIINQTILKPYFESIEVYQFNQLSFTNFLKLEGLLNTNYLADADKTSIHLLNLLGINTDEFSGYNFGEGYLTLASWYTTNHAIIDQYIIEHGEIVNSKFIDDSVAEFEVSNGENTLYLSGVNDKRVVGTDADEVFVSGLGDDTLVGKAGNNTYIFSPNTGSDIIEFDYNSTGTDKVIFESIPLNMVSFKSHGKNLIIGYGEQEFTIANGLFLDTDRTLEFVFEDEVVSFETIISKPIENIENPDSDYFSGWEGDDYLIGNSRDNQLHTYESNDILDGKAGDDKLYGHTGYDTYIFDTNSGNDEIIEDWSQKDGSYLKFNFEQSLINRTYYHDGDLYIEYGVDNQLILREVSDNDLTNIDISFTDSAKFSIVDILTDAYIIGSEQSEQIEDIYVTSNHHIYGLAGNDNLQGSLTDSNHIDGEAGNDIINGGNANDSIIAGDGDDTLFGHQGDDDLRGGQGQDWLEGGEGSDTLIGGEGDDNYFADKQDIIVEKVDEGYDRIFIDVSYDLSGTHIEELHLRGTDNLNGTGSDSNNVMYGNLGSNHLDGRKGSDIMLGGAGDDYYVVDQYETLTTDANGYVRLVEGDKVVEGKLNELNYVSGDSGGIDTIEQWMDHRYYQINDQNVWQDTGRYHILQRNIENLILKGEAKTAFGNELDNTITLNSQDNFVSGYLGNDTIIYKKGGGNDTVSATNNVSSEDTIIIEGYDLSEAIFTRVDNTLSPHDMLMIRFKGSEDSITFIDYFAPQASSDEFQLSTDQKFLLDNINESSDIIVDNKIDYIIFKNEKSEVTFNQQDIDSNIIDRADNHAPTVNSGYFQITASKNNYLSYKIDANTIVDQDPWDSELSYNVTLYNTRTRQQEPLPDWLSFDAETMLLTGMPLAEHIGNYQIAIWGTDLFGSSMATIVPFRVKDSNTPLNLAPISDDNIAIDATEDMQLLINLDEKFQDPEGLSLFYEITSNSGTLPSWLTFNAANNTLSGIPPQDTNDISLTIVATDVAGLSTSSQMSITVQPNLPPQLEQEELTEISLTYATDFELNFAEMFTDPEGQDISYQFSLANGEPLPDWIMVTDNSDGISGIVPNDQNLAVDSIDMIVTATDTAGLSTQQTVTINLIDNQAPIINQPIDNQQATEAVYFSHMLDKNSIVDPEDSGITYQLSLANGQPLPTWLEFDAQSLIVSGTVPLGKENIELSLTGTDAAGLTTAINYTLVVEANQMPELIRSPNDVSLLEGKAFEIKIAEDSFIDPEGSSIDYIVQLADGSDLPSWMSFDKVNDDYVLKGIAPQQDVSLDLQLLATDAAGLSNHIDFDLTVRPEPIIKTAFAFGGTVEGGRGNDILTGSWFTDTLIGNDGNDTLDGSLGRDTLYGNAGDDTLIGGSSNDNLYGGTGDDVLNGGRGNDSYHYELGDGKDTIRDASGRDVLNIDGQLSAKDVLFELDNNDLMISFATQEGSIVIEDWSNTAKQIENVRLDSGSNITNTAINSLLNSPESDTFTDLSQYWIM